MRSGAAPAPTTACPSPGRWWSICTTTQGCGPARCLPPIFTSSPGWPRPCRGCATTTWRAPRRGGRGAFCARPGPAGGARGEASAPRPSQLPVFAETSPLLRELELLDLNGLSPLEALNLLYEWQQRLFPSLRPPPDRHTPA